MDKIELTQEIVHELLLYDPWTGALTWRQRDRKWFKSDRDWNAWNARYAGKAALNTVSCGYWRGDIFGRLYSAHRIIWLWRTGRWPDPQIDHVNRKPWDNRWCNLREATNEQNHRNRSLTKTNTSGVAGVYWDARNGRYRANIVVGSRWHQLGYFKTKDEAIAARKAAERKYGFSPGHGMRRPIQRRRLRWTTPTLVEITRGEAVAMRLDLERQAAA